MDMSWEQKYVKKKVFAMAQPIAKKLGEIPASHKETEGDMFSYRGSFCWGEF